MGKISGEKSVLYFVPSERYLGRKKNDDELYFVPSELYVGRKKMMMNCISFHRNVMWVE